MTLEDRPYFPWCDVVGSDDALIATGLSAWACLIRMNDRWNAVGGAKHLPPRLLAFGDRKQCTSIAEDWLNQHENQFTGYIIHCWLITRASFTQRHHLLPTLRGGMSMTRYQATALLHFQRNKSAILRVIREVGHRHLDDP